MGRHEDEGLDRAETADDRVATLIEQLKSSDPARCREAAEALGGLGDERALMPLIALSVSGDSSVSDAAVTAVGRLGGGRALATVQDLMPTEEPKKRGAASRRRTKGLERVPANDRFAALSVLIADPVPDFRAAALAAVSSLDDPRGLGLAVAGLHDAEPSVRRIAAAVLGQLGPAVAVESLLMALDDPDAAVRRAVVDALGKSGERRAAEALEQIAEGTRGGASENDTTIRDAAREALTRLAAQHPGEVALPNDE